MEEHANAFAKHTRESTNKRPPIALRLKSSLPPQPTLHSLSKTLQHTHRMNVSHFLLTFDLPLSPCNPEKRDWKRRGEPDGGSGERKKRGERKNWGGRRAPPLSPSISPLSLSRSFSPSVSQRGNLVASPLPRRTSKPVHLSCYQSTFFSPSLSFSL